MNNPINLLWGLVVIVFIIILLVILLHVLGVAL
jgi:hypothetical protein